MCSRRLQKFSGGGDGRGHTYIQPERIDPVRFHIAYTSFNIQYHSSSAKIRTTFWPHQLPDWSTDCDQYGRALRDVDDSLESCVKVSLVDLLLLRLHLFYPCFHKPKTSPACRQSQLRFLMCDEFGVDFLQNLKSNPPWRPPTFLVLPGVRDLRDLRFLRALPCLIVILFLDIRSAIVLSACRDYYL